MASRTSMSPPPAGDQAPVTSAPVPSRRIALTLAALLVAPIASSCSDDSGPTIAKGPYVEDATELCEETAALIEAEADELDGDEPGALTGYLSYVAAEMVELLERVQSLGYPDGDEEQLQRAYRTYRDRYQAWLTNPEAATQGQPSASFDDATETLDDYGLEACTIEQ